MLERVRALAARLRREDRVDLGLAALIAVVVTVEGVFHTLGTAGHGEAAAWGWRRSRRWRCAGGSRWRCG